MISYVGNLLLAGALLCCMFQAAFLFHGGFSIRTLRKAVYAHCACLACAFGVLVHALGVNDLSLAYVAATSSRSLPAGYRIAAAWGGHDGSLLSWILVLALWSAAVTRWTPPASGYYERKFTGVLGALSALFLSILLLTSNPFDAAQEHAVARDLNPLLQDPAMTFHPPLLYFGYVGLAVPFAAAIAALLAAERDWTRGAWPWTMIAWISLTLGIFAGAYWAYNELGWGGWWFWDPVENMALVPWLVSTALVHSFQLTRRHATAQSLTVFLAIAAFLLVLMGVFVVRSGAVASVHAFANDGARGTYFVMAFLFVCTGATVVYLLRIHLLQGRLIFPILSREGLMKLNGILLLAAAGAILFGTLYPWFYRAAGWGEISVGIPYFEAVLTPLMIVLLVLLGLAGSAQWSGTMRRRAGEHVIPAIIAVAASVPPAVSGSFSPGMACGVGAGTWVIAATVRQLVVRSMAAHAAGKSNGLAWPGSRFWPMSIAHFGVGLFAVGVAVNTGASSSADVPVAVGGAVQVGPYHLLFRDYKEVRGPNYTATRAAFDLVEDGRLTARLFPERRSFSLRRTVTAEADVYSALLADVYVTMGDRRAQDQWLFRVQYKPLMGWIWSGCALMAAGGGLAALARLAKRRQALPYLPEAHAVP